MKFFCSPTETFALIAQIFKFYISNDPLTLEINEYICCTEPSAHSIPYNKTLFMEVWGIKYSQIRDNMIFQYFVVFFQFCLFRTLFF